MAQQTVYHVVPNGENWAVKRQGSQNASRVAASREDAIAFAEGFARRQAPSRIVVHRDDGTIETQHSFEPGEAPVGRDWLDLLTSPPVMTGLALAAVAAAASWFFLRRD